MSMKESVAKILLGAALMGANINLPESKKGEIKSTLNKKEKAVRKSKNKQQKLSRKINRK